VLDPARRCGLLIAALAACATPTGAPPDAAGAYAGVYATAVRLERSTCTGIQVQNMPTTVTHAPDATDVTLTHAGNSYAGTLAADGSFSTTPKALGTPAETHTLTITGVFATDGFTATVHADVTRDGVAACDYDVGWIGTRTAR
jgi:hypothetical protein